jgi:hypothetical protein
MVESRKATSDGRGLRLRLRESAILNEAAGWLYVGAELESTGREALPTGLSCEAAAQPRGSTSSRAQTPVGALSHLLCHERSIVTHSADQ